jgi:hypothetical protein
MGAGNRVISPGLRRHGSSRGLAALLVIALGCASSPKPVTDATAVAANGPVAPNEFIVLARVIKLGEIEASTLKIEPPQTLCELTLDVLSAQPPTDLLRPSGTKAMPITVYAREVKCVASLRDTTMRLALTFRGDRGGGRWWVTRDLGGR